MITSHTEAQQYAMQLVKQFVERHAKTIEKRKKFNEHKSDIVLSIPLDALRSEYLRHVSYAITSKTKYFNIEVINQILNR